VDVINNFLVVFNDWVGGTNFFLALLLGTGLFFTIYLKFPQFAYFKHAIQILRGKHQKKGALGDTTPFQALTTALSGTVGTGNIAGVAFALFLGGPAALFWMWITAFLGMTTKFVEVTLSHKYRVQAEDGTMAGGPMYYMERKMNAKWLAVIFAIMTVISSIGSGNMPQINSMADGMNASFGIEKWMTGAFMSVLLALVIVGGIKRISHFAEKVVPAMATIYLIGAIAVIIPNFDNIIPSFISIFADVFSGSAAVGGFLGASFALAMERGVGRGLFSNEAGQGSAAIAHASAKSEEPAMEGMVSLLEPFIDTIIICTITGLAILSTGVWNEKHENTFAQAEMFFVEGKFDDKNQEDINKLFIYLDDTNAEASGVKNYTGEMIVKNGISQDPNFTLIHKRSVAEDIRFMSDDLPYTGIVSIEDRAISTPDIEVVGKSLIHSTPLTSVAFTRGLFGDFGKYIVSIGLLLFAFSTAIAWSYYGDRAMTYLFGAKSVLPYRIFYVGCFFAAPFFDGAVIWSLAAVTVSLMTIPNLIGILWLHKDMKASVKEYWDNHENSK
jgi:alanine or glycine:cation symporter, AGCS family